jgi:hypothetical protein
MSGTSRLSRGRALPGEVDLSDFLVMPGLINGHDHLQFALHPRLADPPYGNYVEWGADIHHKFPEVLEKYRSVPRDVRLRWGGIRNLLCGATTVSHHDPLWSELQREDFPVRVVQRYGWGHSLALGGDLRTTRFALPEEYPFIIHACEGVDARAKEELRGLEELGILDAAAVIVHGLAIDETGVALMRERRTSLIVCPSSNKFLYGETPNMALLSAIGDVALGNDSPLTAEGDLLDELSFAIRICGISPDVAYRMVTKAAAAALRLGDGEGALKVGAVGDLIAVRDTDRHPPEMLRTLSMRDVEFVMIGGQVQLASEAVRERLPPKVKESLEALWVDGTVRWLRAPIEALLCQAEEVLGAGKVRLGGRAVRFPTWSRA